MRFAQSLHSVRICLRALRPDATRSVATYSVIALVCILVLTLASAFRSANESFGKYVDRERYDVWVTPEASDNLLRASGRLPFAMETHLASIEGVAEVHPVVRGFFMLSAGDVSADQTLEVGLLGFAFKSNGGLGGPPTLVTGRSPEGARQIVLDRTTAHKLDVGVGDTVRFAKTEFEVTGLSDGTNLIVTQMAFLNIDDPVLSTIVRGGASFFVLEVEKETDTDVVRKEIELLFPDVVTFDRFGFVARNKSEAAAGYADLLSLIYIIGFLVAFVVVAVVVNGIASEKREQIAVLMALGMRDHHLIFGLFWTGGRLAFVGSAGGVAGAMILASILDAWHPILPVQFSAAQALATSVVLVATGAIAAILPAFQLRKIDPFDAFRP